MRRILGWILCILLLTGSVTADAGEKYVALTFDDGPSGKFTRRLLDGLQQRDVKASFFLCGYRLELYPQEAERIYREGHEIGIHGFSHDPMTPMAEEDVTREIRKTAALLPKGSHPLFLRPPGGLCGAETLAAAKRDGLAILSWSLDPQDWAVRDAEMVVRSVVTRVRDGDVILMHDMSDSSVDAALEIVDILTRKGYRFVTVTELARIKGVKLRPGGAYYRFG